MLRKQSKKEEVPNLLELTPERLVDYKKRDDGIIDLVIPKFRHKLLKDFFMKRLQKPTWKVELDEIGTFVWENIDGKTNVEKIGKKMAAHFGENVEPVYERLNQFLYMLRSHKFIQFKEWTGKAG
ncbi:MAG: PqqD family protein [Acidobacteria bacterium]|nr:PqqD family protein [Acidobacteriota bacterium]